MKPILYATLIAALMTPAMPHVADAGPIQRACMKSDRKAASRSLCRCIQNAARGTLSSSDQRIAATFFRDPHRSQEIRQSDRRSHEIFWKKYKEFGARARQMCS